MVSQQEPRSWRIAFEDPRPSRIALAACLLLAATPVFAHDFWIEPDSFRPRAGSVVAVRLRVGQNFDGEPVPRADHLIERFVLVTDVGEAPIVGPDAGEPAGRMRLESPGPAIIGYRSLTTAIELEAAKFEAYLTDEGLEAVIKTRAQRGDSAKPGKEIYSRCAKSLLAVMPAAGTGAGARPAAGTPPGSKKKGRPPLFERALGFTLEIVPLADPYRMKPGASLPVRILHEGKPIGGVLVVAMNAEEPARKISVRSDKSGRASLVLARPGVWMVKAVHIRPAPAASGADWESLWASLTFEVPDPSEAAPRP